jgi:preprotein translocase subunit SecY
MGKAPVPVLFFSRLNSTRQDLNDNGIGYGTGVSIAIMFTVCGNLPSKRKKSYQTNAWYDSIFKIQKTYFSKNSIFAFLSFIKGTMAVVVCVLTFALSFFLSDSWYALEECEEVVYLKYR